MGKKRAFIGKNEAVTFRLLHRSQRDPLVGADGPGRVLAETTSKKLSSTERREEQAKYGIYADEADDYDYLQHLKDANEVYDLASPALPPAQRLQQRYRVGADGKAVEAGIDLPTSSKDIAASMAGLRIPASVLPTPDLELRTPLANRAAPAGLNLDLDPEVLAALDDDFDRDDPDNRLDDNFVIQAMAGGEADQDQDGSEATDEDEEEEEDEDDMDEEEESDLDWPEEETRTRFTNYSVTSSVMRRSEGLQLVDARFEALFDQYDESELGDLEEAAEAAEDHRSGLQGAIRPESDRMLALAAEYAEDKAKEAKATAITLASAERSAKEVVEEEEKEAETTVTLEPSGSKRAWDCESICSTYSNLYNHPATIAAPPPKKSRPRIYLHPKTGLPMEPKSGGLRSSALAGLDPDAMETESRRSTASTIRPKDETPEARRARKAAVKAERRERREERAANKKAFADERKRQAKAEVNARRANGTRIA